MTGLKTKNKLSRWLGSYPKDLFFGVFFKLHCLPVFVEWSSVKHEINTSKKLTMVASTCKPCSQHKNNDCTYVQWHSFNHQIHKMTIYGEFFSLENGSTQWPEFKKSSVSVIRFMNIMKPSLISQCKQSFLPQISPEKMVC